MVYNCGEDVVYCYIITPIPLVPEVVIIRVDRGS